jgi:subfamily B ATP-binding cassette protein MsbA
MRDFWDLCRGLMHYRGMLVAAVIFAVLSAANLGVGLVGIGAVVNQVLPAEGAPVRDLPVLAGELNERVGGIIPERWIASLPTGAYAAVVVLVIALGVVTLIGAAVNFLHAYLSLTIVGRFVRDLRRRVFRHAVRLPLRTVLAQGASHFVSQIVLDTTQVGAGVSALISKALIQIAKGAAAFVVALVTNPLVTLIASGAAPLLYYIIRRTSTSVRRRTRRALEAQSSMYAAAREAVEHLRVVKTSTAEEAEEARFTAIADQTLRQELKVRRARAATPPVVEAIVLIVLGVLAVIAAKAILDRQLAPGEFVLVMASLGIAGACLKPLTGLQHELAAAAGAAERIRGVLREPVEPCDDPRLPDLPPHRQSIVFDHVSLTYPRADRRAVDRVTLRIEHGRTVAFVGPNGSGKTSLLSLIPRLFDPDPPATGVAPDDGPPGARDGVATGGRVLIDGIDIRGVSLRSLRRQIGVVAQDTVLFRGTIRSNLLYASPGASEEAMRRAARLARAEEFILQHPLGYDAPIGEGGTGLSGGQRQRLAIARALLRDPAILIMDEATSMIDADSEAKIAAAIAEFSRGRTVLIIAHRLSTVMHADQIVVMDQGRVVDSGRHADLLARCPTYRLIAENQLVRAEIPGSVGVGAVTPG